MLSERSSPVKENLMMVTKKLGAAQLSRSSPDLLIVTEKALMWKPDQKPISCLQSIRCGPPGGDGLIGSISLRAAFREAARSACWARHSPCCRSYRNECKAE